MLEFFKRPFPINQFTKMRWIIITGPAIFVFLFLFVFRPFGIFNSLTVAPIFAIFGYTLITFFLGIAYTFIWGPIPRRLSSNQWTMGKELLIIFIHITLIGLVNHLFIQFLYTADRNLNINMSTILLENLYFTYSIALFPVVFIIAYFELLARSKHVLKSTELSPLSTTEPEIQSLLIEGEVSENNVELTSNNWRFAISAGNYVEYYSVIDGKEKKELQRNTLSNVEQLLKSASFDVFRSHRSYIVNLTMIKNVTGNAQGYSLSISEMNEKIPVSRSNVSEFNRVMNDYSACH